MYHNKVAGCLLGGAVGDALGAPVEFLSLEGIRSKFGDRGIARYADEYGRIGAITDDTQMTLFTLEGLLAASQTARDPRESVLESYLRWLGTQGTVSRSAALSGIYDGRLWNQRGLHCRRAPGNSCLSALRSHLSRIESDHPAIPDSPINDSKGCGGVMRMAPVGFFDIDCFTTGCELAALTHGHPSGYLASGFLAHLVSEILSGAALEDAIESAQRVLAAWPDSEEVLECVDRAVSTAAGGAATAETIETLGQGWVAEEALAISIYCALRAEDFAHGVRLAVNHGGDSDSTGAITGNILGATWGLTAIPNEFLASLELRDTMEQMAAEACSIGPASHPA